MVFLCFEEEEEEEKEGAFILEGTGAMLPRGERDVAQR